MKHLLSIFLFKKNYVRFCSTQNIVNATNNWITAVTVNHDPEKVVKLFCTDANLFGTVSQIVRKKDDIKLYFEYFAKLPGIKVVKKEYSITKVTDNVYINNAIITWFWDELKNPINVRMTFVFKNDCIIQLHSSVVPTINNDLLRISGKK